MYLKSIELSGFKSFAKKSEFLFETSVTAIVGPNGSGKSNVAEAFRFVLGEQSMKSLRGKRGEDLIFSGTGNAPRSGRASVKVTFDNSKKLLDVDFEEAVIERVVHRDGVNEYLINGSKVRLKDVIELLAGANVGSTGHHIISQGEADRILMSNPSDRREMIEDALGLKVYQYKKQESIKKLERTFENKKQVESLRRENAPHLKFLARQVEKIEKARSLRDELLESAKEYLKRESLYVKRTKSALIQGKQGPERELGEIEQKIEQLRSTIEETKDDTESQELLDTERELSEARREQEQINREVGRLEGQIIFEERRIQEEETKSVEQKLVPLEEFEKVTRDVEREIESGSDVTGILSKVKDLFTSFFETHREQKRNNEVSRKTLEELKRRNQELEESAKSVSERIKGLEDRYQKVRDQISAHKDEGHEAEREMFAAMTKQTELRAVLHDLAREERDLARVTEEFERELTEAKVLVGVGVEEYDLVSTEEDADLEEREKQLERRRTLEKMKIRLEELGGGSADEIMKEYEETKERDEFLEKEVGDLTESVASLEKLIEELDLELHKKFTEGLEKINKEFQHFFELMFGGGKAELTLVKVRKRGEEVEGDEEESEVGDGIDLEVSLPRKRIKGLMMLSGGERALTSIALIFAMSQVNPPPFLILDETDAALDEANSRRYGDMIENLSKRSQLIVITHNRETMSRAGVLYGVTMGADGISKTLSVKFDEAVQVAK